MTKKTLKTYILLFLVSFLLPFTKAHAEKNCRNYYFHETKGKYFDINSSNLPFDANQVSKSVWKILIRPDINSNTAIAGTLFFVSNEGHFIKNWHVLSNFVHALDKKGMISIEEGYHSEKGAIKLKTLGKVLLVNEDTNRLINIEHLYLNFIPAQKSPNTEALSPNFDFIVGQIENVEAPPLKLDSSFKYKKTTKVYSLGFPEKDNRIQHNDLGANGDLKASEGEITSSYFYSYFNKTTLLTSLPLSGGASGSPIISSKGSVIGIVAGGGYHASNPKEISTVGVTITSIINQLSKFPSSAYLSELLSGK